MGEEFNGLKVEPLALDMRKAHPNILLLLLLISHLLVPFVDFRSDAELLEGVEVLSKLVIKVTRTSVEGAIR